MERIQDTALKAYYAVDGMGMGYVDIIYNYQRDEIHVIEVGLVAGMSEYSHIPEAAKLIGLTYDKIVRLAVEQGLEDSKCGLRISDFIISNWGKRNEGMFKI